MHFWLSLKESCFVTSKRGGGGGSGSCFYQYAIDRVSISRPWWSYVKFKYTMMYIHIYMHIDILSDIYFRRYIYQKIYQKIHKYISEDMHVYICMHACMHVYMYPAWNNKIMNKEGNPWNGFCAQHILWCPRYPSERHNFYPNTCIHYHVLNYGKNEHSSLIFACRFLCT